MKRALREIFSDGQFLSWFRIMATPIILVSLGLLVWCMINKYDAGSYICSGLIGTCLLGKVGQSFSENRMPTNYKGQ